MTAGGGAGAGGPRTYPVRHRDRAGCPVLLLQGTADPLVPGQSTRFLAFLPQARLQWLPGLSHVPMSDDPDLVARRMLDFLREHRHAPAGAHPAAG